MTREYFAEGEYVPGSPAQPYYYGPDQIGSVRRVFASAASAPAYSYDPYGNALQGTAPLTDFNYAGMFYNADSGLYLTQYRAYDPVSGRWLSRDPIGETGQVTPSIGRNTIDNLTNSIVAATSWLTMFGQTTTTTQTTQVTLNHPRSHLQAVLKFCRWSWPN